jgi:hypothetical protein
MSNLDETRTEYVDRLSAQYSAIYADLEEQWVEKHRLAQDHIDALGISPVGSLEGLRDFLTKGLDESFERATEKLYAGFDRAVEGLQ